MIFSKTSFAAAVFLSASIAAATPFDGAYDSTVDRCYRTSDTRYILSGNRAEAWESNCSLENPTTVRSIPGAMIYGAYCTGEGARFSYRLMLIGNIPTYEGGWSEGNTDLYVVTSGAVRPLVRCPPGVGTIMYQ